MGGYRLQYSTVPATMIDSHTYSSLLSIHHERNGSPVIFLSFPLPVACRDAALALSLAVTHAKRREREREREKGAIFLAPDGEKKRRITMVLAMSQGEEEALVLACVPRARQLFFLVSLPRRGEGGGG